MNYGHVEALLTLYFHDIPHLRKLAEIDLTACRRRLERIRGEGVYPSSGVMRYDAPSARGKSGSIPDPVERTAARSERTEYLAVLQAEERNEAFYAGIIEEYSYIEERLQIVLGLLPADHQEAIRRRFAQRCSYNDVGANVVASSLRKALQQDYALIADNLFCQISAELLPYCAQKHAGIFPVRCRKRTYFRRSELVTC